MSFIRLKVRAAFMVHGYDADNREIVEQIGEERFVEKLLRIERIQSISEKYLLVSASHGRVAYWEYEGGLTALRRRLEQAGLLFSCRKGRCCAAPRFTCPVRPDRRSRVASRHRCAVRRSSC